MPHNSTYVRDVISKRPFGWTYSDLDSVHNFAFEEIDPFYWHRFISDNRDLPIYVGAVYIALIFGIQKWMERRPPFELKGLLFTWNLGLGLFSIFGFVRFLPGFMHLLQGPSGFYASICLKRDTNISMGYWTLMFILSKYCELGDTFLIVLRKRPLIFLQYWHHLVTLVVTWVISPYMEPVTRWYVVLNYFVHSLMYPYFALKAIRVNVPTWVANLITTTQLLQMIMGFGVNMLSMIYPKFGYECWRHPDSIRAFTLVYGSFLVLFGKLFYDSVIKSNKMKMERLKKAN